MTTLSPKEILDALHPVTVLEQISNLFVTIYYAPMRISPILTPSM